MIKIKHGNHEVISSVPKKSDHAAHAYGHAQLKILVFGKSIFKSSARSLK
jgi:hypothetical protein